MTNRSQSGGPFWRTRQFRLIFFAVIAALALILVLQNFDRTQVQFLFWDAFAPLAWVLLTFMLLGAGIDEMIHLIVRRRRSARAEMRRQNGDERV